MKCTNAIKFHRKSGGAQWRDLQFCGPLVEMFFYRSEVGLLWLVSPDARLIVPLAHFLGPDFPRHTETPQKNSTPRDICYGSVN